jgi:hypothetical protein
VPTPQLRPILQTRIGQSRRSEWTRCRGVLDSGKRFSARFFGVWVITEAKGAAPTALPRQGPTARRGTAGQAGSSSIDTPALSGWADVWRAGPPGLGSGWVLFCGSLTQELIKLWHGPQPVRQSSKRANLDKSDSQSSLRDPRQAGAGWSCWERTPGTMCWAIFSQSCPN